MKPRFVSLLISILLSSASYATDYELIDASPSLRLLQKNYPLDFSWQLNQKVDTLEIRLYRIEGGRDVLVDSVNLPGFRTSLREFGGTLPIGAYRWDLVGYLESQASAVFKKSTNFSIEPHNPTNSEFAKFGLVMGYSQGEYSSANHIQGLSYQSSRSLYGIFFEVPTFDKKIYLKGSLYNQEYNVLGSFARITSYYLDVSYALRYLDKRLQVMPGLRVSYYYLPEIQSIIDTVLDEPVTIYGQTNAFTWGPSVSVSYGISRDWFAQVDLALEKQFQSVGTTWNLQTPNSDFSYSADFMLRGLWFWPFELGFRGGYKKLALGQISGSTIYSQSSVSDIRFSVSLGYLFGSSL